MRNEIPDIVLDFILIAEREGLETALDEFDLRSAAVAFEMGASPAAVARLAAQELAEDWLELPPNETKKVEEFVVGFFQADEGVNV